MPYKSLFSKYFFVALISLLFSGMAHGRSLRIMPLGDSITDGGFTVNGGYFNEGGYRLPLELQILPVNHGVLFVGSQESGPNWMPQRHHEGHGGWRIEQLAEHIEDWLVVARPDVILLMIGTNNMWKEENRRHASDFFDQLLKTIWRTSPHVKVFAASIINTNNFATNHYIARFNKTIYSIVQRHKVFHDITWVDMNQESKITVQDLTDGVHPTAQGFKKMANVWLSFILPTVVN